MDEQVYSIIALACGVPRNQILPDTPLSESGMLDSLAFITMLESFEDYFGIELQPTVLPKSTWDTPASILAAVQKACE